MSDTDRPSGHVTKVHDVIMQSPLLPWNEKLLYYSIRSLLTERRGTVNQEFEASKEALAMSAGLSVRTIQRMLKKWRESGYLAVKEPNRFKPVKYEFLEGVLMARVREHAARSAGPAPDETVSAGTSGVGRSVAEGGHKDVLVRLPIVEVGQNSEFGKTQSPAIEPDSGDVIADTDEDWRTPERDEIVKEMGRKMNEISSDIMSQFVIDEKWLQFLTRDEYNHLVKIYRDLKGRPGA